MKSKLIIFTLFISLILSGILYFNYLSHKVFYSDDFNISIIKSNVDFDQDGIDDYTDILNGAKQEAIKKPIYKSAYYEGGYPPEGEGVCTDIIWRSLQNAGYDLKSLIDDDIDKNLDLYPRVNGSQDKNIDFRRVPNIKVFLERHTVVLTNDISQINKWMPGDIVIFSDNHIGIISDKRNYKGVPYIIHSSDNRPFEEDILSYWSEERNISGHYRFNLN